MIQELQTKGLTAGSIFKILLLGFLFSLGPLFIIAAICSYFGAQVLTLNGVYVVGLKGLITGIIMAPLFPLLFASIFFIFIAFGLWLYTRFRELNIKIKTL